MASVAEAAHAIEPALILLGAGTFAAIAARYLRISPIVGYIFAGILIGPYVLGLMEESPTTALLAELGVVFLLFDIGLHFSLREVRDSKRDMLGLAPTQVGLTALGFTLILVPFGLSWPVATVLGLSLGLSSTAVVSRVLADRNLRSCPLGHSSMSVLIFQDIIAIFLLIFAASLGEDTSSLPMIFGLAFGKALLAFAAAIFVGRFLVRPLFQALAETRNSEAFTAVALLMVLASAWATGLAGLSLTLGAFLAGMAMSDSKYRHQVTMEVQPFRGLLLSFFFMNVGLMLNVPALLANAHWVMLATTVLLVGKTILGFIAAKLNRWSNPGAIQLGFVVGQGGEFTLVITSMAAVVASVENSQLLSIIVAAVALSLAIAPSWTSIGLRLARLVARQQAKTRTTAADISSPEPEIRPVLVFGMTPSVRLAVDAMRHFEIPFTALETDPDRFVAALADGYEVIFGDAADLRMVDLIGASHARATVIGFPRYEVSRDLTPIVRERYPDMIRYVAVENTSDVPRFQALGIRAHCALAEPSGIELVTDLLTGLGITQDDIAEWIAGQIDEAEMVKLDATEPAEAA